MRGLSFTLSRLQSVVGVLLENLDNRDPKEKNPEIPSALNPLLLNELKFISTAFDRK